MLAFQMKLNARVRVNTSVANLIEFLLKIIYI